jgi:hypothetical protein
MRPSKMFIDGIAVFTVQTAPQTFKLLIVNYYDNFIVFQLQQLPCNSRITNGINGTTVSKNTGNRLMGTSRNTPAPTNGEKQLPHSIVISKNNKNLYSQISQSGYTYNRHQFMGFPLLSTLNTPSTITEQGITTELKN